MRLAVPREVYDSREVIQHRDEVLKLADFAFDGMNIYRDLGDDLLLSQRELLS